MQSTHSPACNDCPYTPQGINKLGRSFKVTKEATDKLRRCNDRVIKNGHHKCHENREYYCRGASTVLHNENLFSLEPVNLETDAFLSFEDQVSALGTFIKNKD